MADISRDESGSDSDVVGGAGPAGVPHVSPSEGWGSSSSLSRGKDGAPETVSNLISSELTEPLETDGFDQEATTHAAPGLTFSPSAFLRVKWGIVAVFVFVSAATIPWIWLFLAPVFRAKAVVRVSPVVSRIAFNIEENGMLPLYSSYLNTQVAIIRSPTVLQRALDRKDVRTTRWYQEDVRSLFGAPLSPLERLMKALSVKPQQRTELIDVSVTVRDAKDAEVLANAVVEEYKRYSAESYREQDIRRFEALTNEQTAVHRQIEGLIATKLSLAESLGAIGPDELQGRLSAQLNAMEVQRSQVQRELAMTDWESETAVKDAGQGEPGVPHSSQSEGWESAVSPSPTLSGGKDEAGASDTPAVSVQDPQPKEHQGPSPADAVAGAVHDRAEEQPPQYARDAEWRQRNVDLEASRHQLELAQQLYGDAHPRIIALRADVEHAEHLLQTREAQLEEEWAQHSAQEPVPMLEKPVIVELPPAPEEESLEHRRERLARQIDLLDQDIERKRNKLVEVGKIAKEIAGYDEQIQQKRSYYEVLHSRMTQLEMESKAPARISVASYAIAPSRPFRDRRLLLTAVVLGGALTLGFAIGYLRITMDTRIREAGEVRHAVHVPFLGQLPPFPERQGLMAACTDPVVMERVRMIRTALLERVGGSGHNVVLITSSSNRTGKTSVSFLLGRSLALLGKRTLLVEADLRRPSLFHQLRVGSSAGLTALLAGTADDRTAIVSTGIARFDLITAGERPDSFDPELLANGVFAACLTRWKKSYDFILLDSPPVLPVADARILAGHADGTIMVLRSAHCRRAAVVQTYADLSAAGGVLLGTVLVGAESGADASEYEYYDSTYMRTPALEALAREHADEPSS